jgi:hypothetical protein
VLDWGKGFKDWVYWGRGLSPANFSGSQFTNQFVGKRLKSSFKLAQSGSVELISEKTRLEANRFGRTAWAREMLANVITLFALSYGLEVNLALSSSRGSFVVIKRHGCSCAPQLDRCTFGQKRLEISGFSKSRP